LFISIEAFFIARGSISIDVTWALVFLAIIIDVAGIEPHPMTRI